LSGFFENIVDDHHWQPPTGWETMKKGFGVEEGVGGGEGGIGEGNLGLQVLGWCGWLVTLKKVGQWRYVAVGDVDIKV